VSPVGLQDGGRGPSFCANPSRGVALYLGPGQPLRSLPCGRRNSCAYCAWLAALENMLVVAIDAKQRQPTVGMVLTTGPPITPERFRKSVELIVRWLRGEFGPDLGYLLAMEWTTGQGRRSGGVRRPHGHLLLKRVPDDAELADLEAELSVRWERATGAHRVELRELRSAAGAIAYMVAHHHKRSQAPPPGFSGKRFRPSKNYFESSIIYLRKQAKAQKHEKVARWKLLEDLAQQGVDPDCFDGEQWDDLVESSLSAPAPVVCLVKRNGDLVNAKTRELIERGAVQFLEAA
jgi:hypothetical protein